MFEIDDAKPEDLQGVLRIERLSFKIPWSEKALEAELDKPFGVFWVLRSPKEPVVGYLIGWDMWDHFYLAKIAVAPEQRRSGLGKFMLNKLMEYCRSKDHYWIVLDVRVSNEAAIRFYEEMGFLRLKRNHRFYPDEDGYSYGIAVEP